ncbi:MAG: transposase [Roseiarcus sp.]
MKTKRYPSDSIDEQWARIEPFLPRASKAGRPVEVELREVLNAIRYRARSGGGWRRPPNDFPPWQDRLLVISTILCVGSS